MFPLLGYKNYFIERAIEQDAGPIVTSVRDYGIEDTGFRMVLSFTILRVVTK